MIGTIPISATFVACALQLQPLKRLVLSGNGNYITTVIDFNFFARVKK